jgi:hypothetical protein
VHDRRGVTLMEVYRSAYPHRVAPQSLNLGDGCGNRFHGRTLFVVNNECAGATIDAGVARIEKSLESVGLFERVCIRLDAAIDARRALLVVRDGRGKVVVEDASRL